jgi:hypothetical protein
MNIEILLTYSELWQSKHINSECWVAAYMPIQIILLDHCFHPKHKMSIGLYIYLQSGLIFETCSVR